jgi:hypothetical protein
LEGRKLGHGRKMPEDCSQDQSAKLAKRSGRAEGDDKENVNSDYTDLFSVSLHKRGQF